VFDQIHSARHLPFFTELAALDEHDPDWRSVSAGLVVLRLVDAWIEEGPAAVAADSWGMRSVEAAIEEMPAGLPARAVLRSVLNALKTSSASDMHAIAPRLMAYARSLDLDAKWALAADVYETLIAHMHPSEDTDVVVQAQIRAGHCFRNLGALDQAADRFDSATRIAGHVNDMVGMLRAQVGIAKIAIARGNLPHAEEILDSTVSSARAHALTDVQAVALHDRADVAHMRGNYELAIRLAYEALHHSTDANSRDRLLIDIAGSFYMLGVRSAARDAYLIVEATAQEQYQRWAASINLMQIAAEEGAAPLFERYRRTLGSASLPPDLRAQLLIHIGDCYETLGEPQLASDSLARARDVATQYGFNRLVFIAEEKLSEVGKHERAERPRLEPPVPDHVIDIAEGLQTMRQTTLT
jgi:tetratricopeptide (TPR) repeat protein